MKIFHYVSLTFKNDSLFTFEAEFYPAEITISSVLTSLQELIENDSILSYEVENLKTENNYLRVKIKAPIEMLKLVNNYSLILG